MVSHPFPADGIEASNGLVVTVRGWEPMRFIAYRPIGPDHMHLWSNPSHLGTLPMDLGGVWRTLIVLLPPNKGRGGVPAGLSTSTWR